jgi:hypothetical protein
VFVEQDNGCSDMFPWVLDFSYVIAILARTFQFLVVLNLILDLTGPLAKSAPARGSRPVGELVLVGSREFGLRAARYHSSIAPYLPFKHARTGATATDQQHASTRQIVTSRASVTAAARRVGLPQRGAACRSLGTWSASRDDLT